MVGIHFLRLVARTILALKQQLGGLRIQRFDSFFPRGLPPDGKFICVTARNEALYIREWVAYHLALGFDHIFLFDNDSTDDLRGALKGVPRSQLTVIEWPRAESGMPRQHEAYVSCHRALKSLPHAWILYIDVDEFLVLKKHKTISEFIQSLQPVDAVAFNWRVFGDSGRHQYSPEYVIARFTQASRSDSNRNHLVKSIAKVSSTVMPDLHWPTMAEGAVILDPDGNLLPHNLGPLNTAVRHDVAQLNHYFTKTREEWRIRRGLGRADMAVGSEFFYRDDGEFDLNNRNDVEDLDAFKRVDAIERLMKVFDRRGQRTTVAMSMGLFWLHRLLIMAGYTIVRLAGNLRVLGASRLSLALEKFNSRTRIRKLGQHHDGERQRAVKRALEVSLTDSVVLQEWLTLLKGFSGRRFRCFLNLLCRDLPTPTYLEVGSLFGSTACSALSGNTTRAICVDNWSEFGGSSAEFLENVAGALTELNSMQLIEGDFRKVDFAEFREMVDVYFFDGPHNEIDQYEGIVRALPALKPEFILIVDDYNWPQVRKGTSRALRDAGLVVKSGWEIRTTMNDTHPPRVDYITDWHNGYFVAVVGKRESRAPGRAKGSETGVSSLRER